MQAWAEGKMIQFRKKGTVEWVDLYEDDLRVSSAYHYRIKPEPKYRPFKTQEECWNEMLKHKPFGWVIKKCEKKILITEVLTFGINLHRQESPYGFDEANRILTFTDGTPFGIKKEE